VADNESFAGSALRAYGERQRDRAAAARTVAAPLPVVQGPSQAEMVADPSAPPATIVRPAAIDSVLQRASQLLKQGLISQAQYDQLAQRAAAGAQ
jgi:hypothetical protein